MNLIEAQNLFKKSLLSMKATPSMHEDLRPAGKLSLQQAFEIYHRAYFTRLTVALHNTFSTVQRVMGPETFRQICRHYISSRPSTDYLLADYGHSFPEYLRRSEWGQEHPQWAELARFEWHLRRLKNLNKESPLPTQEVAEALLQADCRLRFVQGMMLFISQHGVYDIWRDTLDPQRAPENLLLFKNRNHVFVEKLSNTEAQIIMALQEGLPLSKALGDFTCELPTINARQFIERLAAWEIIEDIILENEMIS